MQTNSAHSMLTIERLSEKFQLLDNLVREMHRIHIEPTPQSSVQALTHFSFIFRNNQQLLKFIILQRLPSLISLCYETKRNLRPNTKQKKSKKAWKEDIREGLFQVLTSRVGKQHRDNALILSSLVLRYFGQVWAMGTLSSLVQKGEPEANPGKFIEVLIIRASIEIRILLNQHLHPETELSSQSIESSLSDTESSTLTLLAHQQFDPNVHREHMISVCCEILEHAITFLSGSNDEDRSSNLTAWSALPPNVLLNLRNTLNSTFEDILDYIKDVQEMQLENSIVLIAVLRLLGTWLSEETEALQDKVRKILPYILRLEVCRYISLSLSLSLSLYLSVCLFPSLGWLTRY